MPKLSAAYGQAVRGTGPVKIRDIKTILTAPDGIRLVVVKVETSRARSRTAGAARRSRSARWSCRRRSSKYLKPFLIGRDVDEIEDIWQSSYVSSYWRNGPVLFNAMSGVDIALWDIKGKRAGMPVYQLLGGKCRLGAACYYHAERRDFQEVEDSARKGMALGFRHIRVQVACRAWRPTAPARTAPTPASAADERSGRRIRARSGTPRPTCRMVPKLFEHMRTTLGDDVELLHDVHERVTLNQAVNLCKALEPYRLFFLEDPLPPEENDHFRLLRQQTSMPIAMGELFNTAHEYLPLIKERLIDFIRIHISQIGGLSPARKVEALSEFFGVRTAWHGPGDASPVAHAAQLALELASYNFGMHEGGRFPQATRDVFPGCPETKDGYMLATEAPGLGIDIDEKARREIPVPAGAAELRLLVGHDAAPRRHGDPALIVMPGRER